MVTYFKVFCSLKKFTEKNRLLAALVNSKRGGNDFKDDINELSPLYMFFK